MSDNKPIGVIRAPVYPHYSMQLELYNSQKLQLPLEIYTKPETSPDSNVERNRQLLLDRSKVGLQKYGTTTDRTDLTATQWVQHLIEELLDAANYAQKLSTLLPQIFIDPNSPARQTFNDGAPSNVAPVVTEAKISDDAILKPADSQTVTVLAGPQTKRIEELLAQNAHIVKAMHNCQHERNLAERELYDAHKYTNHLKNRLSENEDLIRELKTKIEKLSDENEKLANIESVIEDNKRLTKELDKIINGDGAATDPSLCDIVAQLRHYAKQTGQPLCYALRGQPTPQPKPASQNTNLRGLPITLDDVVVAKMGQPIDYNIVGNIVRLTTERLKRKLANRINALDITNAQVLLRNDIIDIIKSL